MFAPQPNLVLVHGVFATERRLLATARERRTSAFSEYASSLGVSSYDWVDARRKVLANGLLRMARGTAPAVDALEIITLDNETVYKSLSCSTGRDLWREIASCEPFTLDATYSFVLVGTPRLLLEGSREGQRVLWFGNGLDNLSREEFVTHYTTRHGPLVASHAEAIGLRSYRQIPAEQDGLCENLRVLGMGRAPTPAVFAELVVGTPPLSLSGLIRRRAATREIATDEKRHIDFSHSMLVLA